MDNPDIKEFYLGLSELSEKKKYSEAKHYKRRKRWLVWRYCGDNSRPIVDMGFSCL